MSAADSDPLARLYHDHHGWLQGWLGKKLGCADDAADLTQDAFVRVLRHRDELAGVHEPRAYLVTIAKRLMLNHLRHRSLERAYAEALAALPEACHPSPEDALLIQRTLDELDRLLAELSDKARTAFLLVQLEGLSYSAVAQRMGLSFRTVQRYVAQGYEQCILASL